MTISSTVRIAGPFIGTSTATVFPFAFKVFTATNLQVVRVDTSTGLESTLVLTTDYTVSLNADQDSNPGGNVTLLAVLATGFNMVITSDIANLQPTDLTNQGGFYPEVITDALDRATIQIQQMADELTRSIKIPISDGLSLDMELPSAAARANSFLAFDATGEPTVVTAGSSGAPTTITRQQFSGTGSQVAYTLASDPGALGNSCEVFVGGIYQQRDTYTIAGTTLTFTAAPVAGTDNIEVVNFLTTAIGTTDSSLVTYVPAGTSATQRTVQAKLREVVSVKDFGAVGDGTTSDTTKIQACFDAAVVNGVKEIFIDSGNYLLTNTRNDASYTCAVIIKNLKNCTVRGAKGAKFTVSASGSPVVGFGFFRLEQCENVTFTGFELDGSGVAVTTGANRLLGIAATNWDVNSPSTNLAIVNKQLEFSHLYIHDSGGGVQVIRRSMSLVDTPMTEGLSVHDCRMENLLGVDHGVSCPRTRNVHVFNNRFVNNIPTVTPQDNMAVDASSGAEVVHIHNNYVYGFYFGMKCESVVGVGPSATEIRSSKRVIFENNFLEEIGDPLILFYPGPSGGDTYGIKINGKDCVAIGNTIKQRTIGVTLGGLGLGIVVVNTHNEDSHVLIEGNMILGCQYGILHNDSTANTLECSVIIRDNRVQDSVVHGIETQANCLIENNKIFRTGQSAVSIQPTIRTTFVKNNFAYNCASTNNAFTGSKVVFYQQGTGAQGFFSFEGNMIVDERGASAAEFGYFFRAGTERTNAYIFTPGYTTGLLTGMSYDKYFSVIGTSLALDGTTEQGPRTFYTTDSPVVIAPWNIMTWKVGDIAILATPVVGSPKSYVCTVAGTPGTWVASEIVNSKIPVTLTANASITLDTSNYINNKSGSTLTLTLLSAATYPGASFTITNNQAQTVVSASSNVVPKAGGAAGTAILAATAGLSATLVSNGTNWVITQ